MATILLNRSRGRINLVKNVIKPLYLYGKTEMKYEISVS